MVHAVINAQVPVPAAAPVAVDWVKTQIPSNPPELHAVLVVYVEQLAFAMQAVPFETHDDKATAQTLVDVPFWISAQASNLHLAVLLFVEEASSQ